MAMTEQEALASLKILVSVARADGVLQDSERSALESTLAETNLPGTTVQGLLEGAIDLDAELKKLSSAEAREHTYAAAAALAKADGACSAEEQRVLDKIKESLQIPAEQAKLLDRLLSEAKDTVIPASLRAIADPEERAKEIREDTLKYAILSGVLGAFPIPGVAILTDLAAVGLQVKLVHDIAQYWGHPLDKQGAKALVGSIVGGAGARIAVTNLAKLVPGWGSVVGATSSFAATWAVGRVANSYFENGGRLDQETLRSAFKSAKKEGEKAYQENKAAIEEKQKANEARITQLSEDLKAGRISQEQYEQQLVALS